MLVVQYSNCGQGYESTVIVLEISLNVKTSIVMV